MTVSISGVTISTAVVSVVSISGSISLGFGISRPLAEVTVSTISIAGISIVSTVVTTVTSISKTVSVTVSTAVVSVVSISSSISLGYGISRPLAKMTDSISVSV